MPPFGTQYQKHSKPKSFLLFVIFLLVFICKQSIVAVAQGIPAYIPANGLLGWYPFNDNPNDESGYGHNGVIYGSVSYGTDRFGIPNSCYQSDGDGMIDVPVNNFPVGNASRSWTAFFKCYLPYQISPYGGRDFVTYGNNSYLGGRFTLYTTDTTIGIEYINGTVTTPYTFDSAWHNLTVTYSTGGSDSVKLYIDGLITPSSVFNPISAFNTDTGLRHGIAGTMNYVPPFSDSWWGELDDIGVWNRALTPCEVWDIWIGSTSFTPIISDSASVLNTSNTYTGYQWLENGSAIPGATNSSYNATTGGSYQVAVTDSGGCSGTSIITIVPGYACDTLSLTDSLHACKNSMLNLNATVSGPDSVLSITWIPSTGLSNPGILNPQCTLGTMPASYTLTVQALMQNGDTCTTSASVYIAVSNLSPQISASHLHCSKEVSFTASDSIQVATGATFTWQFGDNTAGAGDSVLHTYSNYGQYNVSLTETDTFGCKDSAEAMIAVTPNLNLTMTPNDTIICGQQDLQLIVTGADSAYVWSPVAGLNNPYISNPVASIDSTIKYIVTGFDSGACVGTDSVTIHFAVGPVVNVTGNTSLCYGQYDQLDATGAVTYSWFPADYITNNEIFNPLVHPVTSTTYIVTGTDSSGCKGEDSIYINVEPLPVLTVSASGTVSCSDTAVQLSVSGATTYTWNPGQYVVNDDVHSSEPFVSPSGNTVFLVTGTDGNGCSNTDSILVVSDKSAGVFVPTAFTPNNDGLNDVIFPRIYCDLILDQFSIYNRWGQQVFTTKTEGAGWDGKLRGVPQPIGSFDYFVKGHKKSNGKVVLYKGSFTLIR